jgi:hypothetical protein
VSDAVTLVAWLYCWGSRQWQRATLSTASPLAIEFLVAHSPGKNTGPHAPGAGDSLPQVVRTTQSTSKEVIALQDAN